MRRDIEAVLHKWYENPDRLPLLMRGARQIGKSHTIRAFGKEQFGSVVEVNFELRPNYASCFESLVPTEIIDRLSIITRQDILPGTTLLFFDEIQKCPAAITSLRYFREQMPDLHVIAAGSLLDFALASEAVSVPVGRVQYAYMKPLSFGEFLDAVGESKARSFITGGDLQSTGTAIHDHLISIVKKYFVIGGMPAAVRQYAELGGGITGSLDMQTSISQTYRDDFGKYAAKIEPQLVEAVYLAAAKMVGRKFRYSHVDPEVRSRVLKEALLLLERAGVVYRARATSGAGQPLEVEADERTFKTVFVDIGLMQNLCGLAEETTLAAQLLGIYSGALAEQFVGQELIAHQNSLRAPGIFFWMREARNSSAEVDYLYPHGSVVLPVEVKAGTTGTLRSAHLFLKQYGRGTIIKISQSQFSYCPPVLNVPLYAIEAIPRLLRLVDSGELRPSANTA